MAEVSAWWALAVTWESRKASRRRRVSALKPRQGKSYPLLLADDLHHAPAIHNCLSMCYRHHTFHLGNEEHLTKLLSYVFQYTTDFVKLVLFLQTYFPHFTITFVHYLLTWFLQKVFLSNEKYLTTSIALNIVREEFSTYLGKFLSACFSAFVIQGQTLSCMHILQYYSWANLNTGITYFQWRTEMKTNTII